MIELEPIKSIPAREDEAFNEKWRKKYEKSKEKVSVIFEKNLPQNENIEQINFWCCLWPGIPKECWEIPFDIAVSVPKYVVDQVSKNFKIRYL